MWKHAYITHKALAGLIRPLVPVSRSLPPSFCSFRRGVKSWTKQTNQDSASRYAPPASSSRLRGDLPDYDDDFPVDAKRSSRRSDRRLSRHQQQAEEEEDDEELNEDELNAFHAAMQEPDKIILKNMEYYGHHGVYAHETSLGQPFQVDLELEADLSRAAKSDDLADTVNYEKIHAVVGEIMTGKPYKLLERVSFLIVEALLEQFEELQSVHVTIRKPNVGLKGPLDYAAVSIKRTRVQGPEEDEEPEEEEEEEEEEERPVSRRRSHSSRVSPPSRSFSSKRQPAEPVSNPVRPEHAPKPQRNLFAELDAKFEEYDERARASSTETTPPESTTSRRK